MPKQILEIKEFFNHRTAEGRQVCKDQEGAQQDQVQGTLFKILVHTVCL